MHQVLRRIAIHGGLTALFLGVVGLIMAEVASTVFLAPAGPNAAQDPPVPATGDADVTARELRSKLPVTMAIWGFGIIAFVELLRYLLKGARKPVTPPPPPAPDEAEKLLEELLIQAESKVAPPRGAAHPNRASGEKGLSGEAHPSQSTTTS